MSDNTGTFYLIPHTHWEGAVFKTREQYLEMGLPNILRALRMLKAHPEFRFTLDQVCYVKPFLERYPEEAATFRQMVREGRLAIVGGTDVMLDVNMPGGESFVRQVLYGKGYFRRALGVDVTSSWQLDTFGHHAQIPQLLKLSGFTAFWFFRGVPAWETPAEFCWEGLDGTRIPAFWLATGYALAYGSPRTLPEFTKYMTGQYALLDPFTGEADRVAACGPDVMPPEEHVPALLEAFNAQPEQPFRLQYAVPTEYEAAVAKRGELPVVSGELNPIFQGIYSSRIELKQRTRELETSLTDAEKLGAVLRVLGREVDDAHLWEAWEPMLFNQAHDLMSGVMTDQVFDDSMRGYDFARTVAGDVVDARLDEIIQAIDTRGDGIPLVVVNTLGSPRTDLATADIGISDPGIHGVAVFDSEGGEVPCQVLATETVEDGSLVQATVAFLAQDVPALGHAVYHVRLQTRPGEQAESKEASLLENDRYRLQVDLLTGAITGLQVKDGAWEALRDLANIVAMEKDEGDFWELYRTLDAASRIGMTGRHAPPLPNEARFSTDETDEPGTLTHGPVFSECLVTHPFGDGGRFRTRIRLYHCLPRIDIRTSLLNRDSIMRCRVLFPTTLVQAQRTDEIPFGAIARPDGVEYPAQNWIDLGDGRRGIALLNRGLPGNNIADGTLMLSLMRSTSIVAYGFGGGYEPGMGSDSGLELGKELTFDYALLPHAGDWRQADVTREGMAFTHPLLVRHAAAHHGVLPPRWGLLSISHASVAVSSLKIGTDGHIVLRIYESSGEEVEGVTLDFSGVLASADEVNLLEDPLQPLQPDSRRLVVSLRPFEIKTIAVKVESPC